jgi:flagellar basal body-associated protein FliL
MIRLIVSCIWICLVTAAAGYGGVTWKIRREMAATAAPSAKMEKLTYHKAPPLNVPMIANGAVQGYVVVQFGFTETEQAEHSGLNPQAFLLDEAFRKIYTDPHLDFHHLEKYNIAVLTKTLVTAVNRRMNEDAIKEVLVEEINFVSKDEISH